MILCIISLSIILLVIFLFFLYIKTKNLYLILKISASSVFIYTALLSYINNSTNINYFILIFIALIFSFLGDIFLVLKAKPLKKLDNMFFLGLTCFLITHILYSSAFISLGSLDIFVFILSILVALTLITFFKSIKNFDFKNGTIPSYIYIFAISFMFCNALGLIRCNLNKPALILLITGTLLFFISDFIISFIFFFKNSSKFLIPMNLLTYYLGQILIALSLLYI